MDSLLPTSEPHISKWTYLGPNNFAPIWINQDEISKLSWLHVAVRKSVDLQRATRLISNGLIMPTKRRNRPINTKLITIYFLDT